VIALVLAWASYRTWRRGSSRGGAPTA